MAWRINNGILNGYPHPVMADNILVTNTFREANTVTTVTESIRAVVGKTVVAVVSTRGATTFSAGWTQVNAVPVNSTGGATSQQLYVLVRTAESTAESITVTVAVSNTIYVQLLSFDKELSLTELWRHGTNGTAVQWATVNPLIPVKTAGHMILWALTATSWSTGSNWTTTPNDLMYITNQATHINIS